jgi:anti-sigma-K factor RskA
MSDRSPLDDRAGLYVLGALNAEEMRAVRLAAGRDDVLAAEIAEWERRLTPLTALIDPVAPPATLWSQLEGRLARITGAPDPIGEIYHPPTQGIRSRRRHRSSSGGASPWWRVAAIGAMALAAGLAVALLIRPVPTAGGQVAMLLPARPGEGGWLLQLQRNGEIRAVAQGALPATLQQSYELWALPENGMRPLPMGLLPVTSTGVIKPPGLPGQKFQFLVSLEPKGGSPTGLPTGQVLFSSDYLQR